MLVMPKQTTQRYTNWFLFVAEFVKPVKSDNSIELTYPTQGMFQDFRHVSSILFHHTCQELDTMCSDGLKQETSKNHLARI